MRHASVLEQGYEATSISDLTKAMRITPPALYGAFGDKKSSAFRQAGLFEAVDDEGNVQRIAVPLIGEGANGPAVLFVETE
jgi:AcrR family transcriptional regulator